LERQAKQGRIADAYSFGFNGQMKDNEVAGMGNHNTAMFWEYDTRTAWRWNLDPKPQINISDYSVLGNNPIYNIDLLGNTFHVSSDKQSRQDIKDLGVYGEVIAYDAKGIASIDFNKAKHKFTDATGKLDEAKFNKYKDDALADKGFNLIKDLIDDPQKFHYGAEKKFPIFYKKAETDNWLLGQVDRSKEVDNSANRFNWFSNTSITPRGDEETTGGYEKPADGYDGAVRIYPGRIFIANSVGSLSPVPRASFIFHELKENYYRTVKGKSYDDAYNQSILDESTHSDPVQLNDGKDYKVYRLY